jgi:hypothetical protein
MADRPILFSAPMVCALLAGTKTQTRRVVKPQPPPEFVAYNAGHASTLHVPSGSESFCWSLGRSDSSQRFWPGMHESVFCPYGQPGDRLWVRETWSHDATDLEACRAAHEDVMAGLSYGPYYRATEEAPETLRWRSSIHMPRWASRITLEITKVRVERVREMNRGDAMAEGCPFANMADGLDPRDWYSGLWDEINGAGSWAANPWVWVVSFRRVEQPGGS